MSSVPRFSKLTEKAKQEPDLDMLRDFDKKVQADDIANQFDELMSSKQDLPEKTRVVDIDREITPEVEANIKRDKMLADRLEYDKRSKELAKHLQKSPEKLQSLPGIDDLSQIPKSPDFEDMSGDSRSFRQIDDLIKQSNKQLLKKARLDKLKSLAKGVGKFGLEAGKGLALGLALDPTELGNSEMPKGEELRDLEAELRMKNAPYNYPTKFNELRKLLGK